VASGTFLAKTNNFWNDVLFLCTGLSKNNLLQKIDKLTGIRQYERLLATAKPQEEFAELLEILCRVSAQFPFIPEKAQQEITSAAVVSDQEFIGLNARVVNKWLYSQRERFIGVVPKPEDDPNWQPLTGEARDKRIQELADAIAGMVTAVTPKPTKAETDLNRLYKKTGVESYKNYLTPADLQERELRRQWGLENHDRLTGKPLSSWISFEKWKQQQTQTHEQSSNTQ
jgi:hypothetical protein